jgi:hypothetical protein
MAAIHLQEKLRENVVARFVTGHGFSRAAKAKTDSGALAPEGGH